MQNQAKTSVQKVTKADSFVIATLNYGGILNSPFEFFSNNQEEQIKISEKFKSLIPTYFKNYDPKTFTWNIGKIDKNIQKQRYTPIYNPTVGVQNNRLVSVEEFKNLWDQHFSRAEKNVKIDRLPTEEQKEVMKKFDLICYHTLICHAYQVKDISEVQKDKRSSDEYLKLTKRFFDRSYWDQTKKLQKLQNIFDRDTIHVYFIQEPTKQLIKSYNQLQNTFHVQVRQNDAPLIIVKKSVFNKIQTFDQIKNQLKFTIEDEEKIKANKKTRILFCDQFIFINVHLSSKHDRNKIELDQLKAAVLTLKDKCPKHQIVIGGEDTNNFLKQIQRDEQKAFNQFQSLST